MARKIHVRNYKRFKNGKWEDVTDYYKSIDEVQLSNSLKEDIQSGKSVQLEFGVDKSEILKDVLENDVWNNNEQSIKIIEENNSKVMNTLGILKRYKITVNHGFANVDVELNEKNEKILYLSEIHVEKGYRKKGIGNKMLNEIIKMANKKNLNVEVMVSDIDPEYSQFGLKSKDIIKIQDKRLNNIINFYKKFGFVFKNKIDKYSRKPFMVYYPIKKI